MGNKDSKPAAAPNPAVHGGFVAETVAPSAALIGDNHSRKSHHAKGSHGGGSSSHSAPHASASHQPAEPPQQRLLPVVIRYKAPDTKGRIQEGHQLMVMTANGQRFPMSRSDDNYFAIVEMPAGDNAFKFMDGQGSTFIDTTQPSFLKGGEGGEAMNLVNVNEVLLQTKDDDDAMDDASGWGQERTVFEETRKYPPMLPPHLRYTPLNAPPTQVRVATDGSMMPIAADHSSHLDAEHLPLPLSVTINHIYFQRREDHTISGITTRYRDKYTTVAYYRGGTSCTSAPRGSVPIPTA